jgi:hypothetical protein
MPEHRSARRLTQKGTQRVALDAIGVENPGLPPLEETGDGRNIARQLR